MGRYHYRAARSGCVRRSARPAKHRWWIGAIFCRLRSAARGRGDYAIRFDIMEEIAEVTPSMAGIHYTGWTDGLQWLWSHARPSRHADSAYTAKFARRAKFSPVQHQPPAELPDENYPFMLTRAHPPVHHHTGTHDAPRQRAGCPCAGGADRDRTSRMPPH